MQSLYKKLRIPLKILKILLIIFLLIFIVISLYTKFFPKSNGLFGIKSYAIVSDSMKPYLSKGDIIISRKIDTNNIQVGDIIVYQGLDGDFANKIITHKVMYIQTEGNRKIFYTKGSANTIYDPAVYEEQIYGKYIYKIKVLSIISKIIRTPIGFILIVIIPLLLMFLIEFTSFKNLLNERFRNKKIKK